ncbi:pleiotropic drug resistance protein 3 [Striga asiatica]|uniref:Pleiotropic drug resistance protein 3 n=1 Tax=Striga asiatica TaxID=4170 RepID=A0A5A7PEC5_STRAF|nr:pleiotropic drug resistance protein 3 [Striga asiatica]
MLRLHGLRSQGESELEMAIAIRWEFSTPTPFIRSHEFLWQEGYTASATNGLSGFPRYRAAWEYNARESWAKLWWRVLLDIRCSILSLPASLSQPDDKPRPEDHSGVSAIAKSHSTKMVLPFEPLSLAMKERGFTQKKLQLLCDITGAFRPGVLTALMGVTTGKTTLSRRACRASTYLRLLTSAYLVCRKSKMMEVSSTSVEAELGIDFPEIYKN